MLLLKDRMLFVKIGGQFADGVTDAATVGGIAGGLIGNVIGSLIDSRRADKAAPQRNTKIEALFEVSAEDLLAQDKLNFEIPYTEIMSIVMKDSLFSLNGSRAGVFNLDLIDKKEKFDIAANQSFSACVETVTTQLPDKVIAQRSVRKQQAIIALATLVALAALAIVLPLSLSNQWSEFVSTDAAFAVEMPGSTQHQSQVDQTSSGPITTDIYSLDRAHYSYAVARIDFGQAALVDGTPEEILTTFCGGLIEGLEAQLISQDDCNLGQYPGKELQYTVPQEGLTGWHRVFWVDGDMYQLLALSDTWDAVAEDALRFMDSFRLTGG